MLTYINLLLFVPAILADTREASRHSLLDKRTLSVANSQSKVRRSAQTIECTSSDSCAECFGAGYISCPGSSIDCYNPGSDLSGLDSCPGTPAVPSSLPTSTIVSSRPGSTTTGVGDNCAAVFGTGSITCSFYPNCYNPTEGDVCCSDGSKCSLYTLLTLATGANTCPGYCLTGETCSSNPGYCESTTAEGVIITRPASGSTPTAAPGGAPSSTSTYSYPATSTRPQVYPTSSAPASSPTPSARYTGGSSTLSTSMSLVLSGIFPFGIANMLWLGVL